MPGTPYTGVATTTRPAALPFKGTQPDGHPPAVVNSRAPAGSTGVGYAEVVLHANTATCGKPVLVDDDTPVMPTEPAGTGLSLQQPSMPAYENSDNVMVALKLWSWVTSRPGSRAAGLPAMPYPGASVKVSSRPAPACSGSVLVGHPSFTEEASHNEIAPTGMAGAGCRLTAL